MPSFKDQLLQVLDDTEANTRSVFTKEEEGDEVIEVVKNSTIKRLNELQHRLLLKIPFVMLKSLKELALVAKGRRVTSHATLLQMKRLERQSRLLWELFWLCVEEDLSPEAQWKIEERKDTMEPVILEGWRVALRPRSLEDSSSVHCFFF